MTEVVQQEKTEQEALKYKTDYNYGVMTRDGVRLATIIHHPVDNTPRETIVLITPYNATGFYQLAQMMSERLPIVFNYIIQDSRGRYNSGGEFSDNAFDTANDTVDTLDWITEQSWSDGVVHIFGPSYLGWVALQALKVRDQTKAVIKSIFSPMTFRSLADGALYRNGAMFLHHAYCWSMMMSGRVQGPLNYVNIPFPDAYDTAFSMGVQAQGYPTHIWDMFKDEEILRTYDVIYQPDSSFDTKATFIASYFDNITYGSIKAFEEVLKIGGVRPNLIIGPWGHNGYVNSLDSVGQFKITKAQSNVGKDFMQHLMICNSDNKAESLIKVYVLRRDEWLEFNQWPIPGNNRTFEFSLNQTKIKAEYDRPVQTRGGAVWDNVLDKERLTPGAEDQRSVNRREDVIRLYTSEFEQDTTFIGDVDIEVIGSASISNSFITAKLNLVDQEGNEYIIKDGIATLSNFNKLVKIPLDFGAFEIKAGEKLMVELSWSNYPKFERPRHGQDYVIKLEPSVSLSLREYID